MKESKNIFKCMWAYRLEILGLALIIIATLLTIATANSLGIAAMFLVALVLCAHRCVCHKCCNQCHPDDEEVKKKPVAKKNKE